MKNKKIKISIIICVLLITVIFIYKKCSNENQKIIFNTVKVIKSDIRNTVSATGTIQAIKVVDVGTQVSGTVEKIYVDFNSEVKKGQLLAELDKRPLISSLENAQASLENAQAELTYQTSNFNRIKALNEKKMVAESEYDVALYNLSKAKTNLKIAETNFSKAKINLDYSYIYSPIDGVILNRAVDEGQTVAASFNTPTLFAIANDLTQMQVEANIDEADIGLIKKEQRVTFTVDAFPDDEFSGEVTEIRLNPTTTSNVVTYTVIIKASNPDFKLMPGMTANIDVIIFEKNNILVVPSNALKYYPDSLVVTKYLNPIKEDSKFKKEDNNKALVNKDSVPEFSGSKPGFHKSRVWIKENDNIRPVFVETGITDDVNIEIIDGLSENQEIIISSSLEAGSTTSQTNSTSQKSPFMPTPPSRSNKKSTTNR